MLLLRLWWYILFNITITHLLFILKIVIIHLLAVSIFLALMLICYFFCLWTTFLSFQVVNNIWQYLSYLNTLCYDIRELTESVFIIIRIFILRQERNRVLLFLTFDSLSYTHTHMHTPFSCNLLFVRFCPFINRKYMKNKDTN